MTLGEWSVTLWRCQRGGCFSKLNVILDSASNLLHELMVKQRSTFSATLHEIPHQAQQEVIPACDNQTFELLPQECEDTRVNRLACLSSPVCSDYPIMYQ